MGSWPPVVQHAWGSVPGKGRGRALGRQVCLTSVRLLWFSGRRLPGARRSANGPRDPEIAGAECAAGVHRPLTPGVWAEAVRNTQLWFSSAVLFGVF